MQTSFNLWMKQSFLPISLPKSKVKFSPNTLPVKNLYLQLVVLWTSKMPILANLWILWLFNSLYILLLIQYKTRIQLNSFITNKFVMLVFLTNQSGYNKLKLQNTNVSGPPDLLVIKVKMQLNLVITNSMGLSKYLGNHPEH